jgi:hypothetical protein
VDENGKIPKIGKLIMLGFPHSEIQVTKLKEYGFDFDRVLYLNDTSEEEPGKQLKERFIKQHGSDSAYEWEKETEAATKIVSVIKEFMSEEIVKEINCTGTPE